MPRKKIYDIKPPKLTKKAEGGIKEFVGAEKATRRQPASRRRKESRPIWPLVSIAAGAVLLVVCVYLFFKLPKADIIIWPKVDVLSYEQTVAADKSVDLPDAGKSIVPAEYFETEKTLSQDFPATGNATDEGKASGTITVFNKYDPPTSMTLKAGTRFLSDSGKLFTIDQKIIVPAGKKSGGKITPGSVQVEVTAAEGGGGYNIAPSSFSVPGLKGTAYYYSIYATSSEAMSGGYESKVKKVTDDDMQAAKDTTVEKAANEAVAQLKNQLPPDYVLLEDAVSSNTVSAASKTKIGTTAESFTYSATVKAACLAFKKSDLEKFAKDYIISQMPDGKTLLESSFKLDYSADKVDISGGKATLKLNFSSGIYQNLDKNSLSLSLMGKNAGQIQEIVNNRLGGQLSKSEINFWPFWVTKAPNSQKALNVILKFE